MGDHARPRRGRRGDRSGGSTGWPAPRGPCATTTSGSTAPAIPDGLAGEQIPIEARIVAAADTYCAITDDRLFRRSRTHTDAIRELERSAGTQLDPWVVAALVRSLERERGRIAASLLRGVA